jgi:hypothetical protein
VGISPAQTGNSDAFSASTTVYVPTYNVGAATSSTWVRNASHGYTVTGWPTTVSGTAENGAATIPYLDGRSDFSSTDYTRNSTFVMDAERNTDALYLEKRGDICQYIGKTQGALKGFRLPTSSEMGTANANDWSGSTGGWQPTVSPWPMPDNAAGNPEGMSNLRESAKNKVGKVFASIVNYGMGAVVLPASGYRPDVDGVLTSVGNTGNYWSGSAQSEVNGFRMTFAGSLMHTISLAPRSYALSVRCVRN